MARPPRVELAGGLYHVLARGNERRAIFRDDHDRRIYLSRLAECRARYGLRVIAYCLMPNHVHLALQRGPVRLSKVMLALHSYYRQKFNWRHTRVGHLFQGRYKAVLVDSERYLDELIRYIHLNPVRAGLVDRPEAHLWSSDRNYRRARGPAWLDLDVFLARLAPTKDAAARAYRRWMGSDEPDVYEAIPSLARTIKGEESFAVAAMRYRDAGRLDHRAPWTPEDFARVAARLQGLSLERLGERHRRIPESLARAITAYLARDRGISASSLALLYRRDESALAHGARQVEKRASTDPSFRRRLEGLAADLDRARASIRNSRSQG